MLEEKTQRFIAVESWLKDEPPSDAVENSDKRSSDV